ncbi:hypothetical protein AAMO2058_000085400 [Amorphochlora amoebiformis]
MEDPAVEDPNTMEDPNMEEPNTMEDPNQIEDHNATEDPNTMEDPTDEPNALDSKTTEPTEDPSDSQQPHLQESQSPSHENYPPPSDESKDPSGEVTDEGFYKVFVGGITRDTTDHMFVDVFSNYGEVVDSVVMRDKYTGSSRGFGFVTFKDDAAVEKVLASQVRLDGRVVDCKRAVPKGQVPSMGADGRDATGPPDQSSKKIFVGGVSYDTNKEALRAYFEKFGDVQDAVIMRDVSTGRSRGFGFVTFVDEETAKKVMEEGKHEIDGKTVDCKVAIARSQMGGNRDRGGSRHGRSGDGYSRGYRDRRGYGEGYGGQGYDRGYRDRGRGYGRDSGYDRHGGSRYSDRGYDGYERYEGSGTWRGYDRRYDDRYYDGPRGYYEGGYDDYEEYGRGGGSGYRQDYGYGGDYGGYGQYEEEYGGYGRNEGYGGGGYENYQSRQYSGSGQDRKSRKDTEGGSGSRHYRDGPSDSKNGGTDQSYGRDRSSRDQGGGYGPQRSRGNYGGGGSGSYNRNRHERSYHPYSRS